MQLPRLKEKYLKEIVPELKQHFDFNSVMQVPKIEKISINQGLGAAVNDKKLIQLSVDELSQITGQKAVSTYAKSSISNFKLREGMPIGCKVTLRKEKMYDFFEKLIKISLPRTRDFRGLNPNSFDGRGNYSIGIKEHIIFPEIDYDKIDRVRGMDITIVTSASDDMGGRALLRALGFPFREEAS